MAKFPNELRGKKKAHETSHKMKTISFGGVFIIIDRILIVSITNLIAVKAKLLIPPSSLLLSQIPHGTTHSVTQAKSLEISFDSSFPHPVANTPTRPVYSLKYIP